MPSPEAGAVVRKSPRHLRDAMLLSLLALVVRGALVLWAKDRFPPADDGSFYHVVAQRIAHGAGYTWLWPDGVVSYAAHYPVGYPALLGLAYAAFGASPAVAMALNAALGALAVFAGQRVVLRYGTRRQALLAGLLLALHPGLVFYTPALMTEGVTAELLVVATWLTLRVGWGPRLPWRLALLGVCAGLLTLIRPQLVIMVPIFGAFAVASPNAGLAARALRALGVTGLALAVCLPWTFRNCARMDRCVFVSANGGWNLLIGSAPEANGSWIPIAGSSVPPECRNVFGEAEKDRCFGNAGANNIRKNLLGFLRLVPRKLSVTFDYFGAPGHYLHTSNWRAFDEARQVQLGVVETVFERLVLLAAIVQAARIRQPGRKLRLAAALPAALFSVLRAGFLGYLGFVLTILLSGKELLKRPLGALTAALVLTTAATHAVFFGAGRYGFVCAAMLCIAAVSSGEARSGEAAERSGEPAQ